MITEKDIDSLYDELFDKIDEEEAFVETVALSMHGDRTYYYQYPEDFEADLVEYNQWCEEVADEDFNF